MASAPKAPGTSEVQPDWYFIHSATKARVNAYLSLPATGSEQDWELELSDASRWREYFQILVEHKLSSDPEMEIAVAALLIGSIEDALDEGIFSASDGTRVAAFFHENPILRNYVRRIWCVGRTPLYEEIITPWLVLANEAPSPPEDPEPPPSASDTPPPIPKKPWYQFW
ncbi:MAG: hypothetical protein IPK50_14470 [Fibrobacterota bacterium]|nr:hypothetical protein [Fibrobacterota bacterium]QQS03501.1 MAG: hypothetical protein IPK50_14470 [Fibrobacterota bacterium]